MFWGQEDERPGVGHVVDWRAVLCPTLDVEAKDGNFVVKGAGGEITPVGGNIPASIAAQRGLHSGLISCRIGLGPMHLIRLDKVVTVHVGPAVVVPDVADERIWKVALVGVVAETVPGDNRGPIVA